MRERRGALFTFGDKVEWERFCGCRCVGVGEDARIGKALQAALFHLTTPLPPGLAPRAPIRIAAPSTTDALLHLDVAHAGMLAFALETAGT